MPLYRKRPIVVEATQYHPGLEDDFDFEDELTSDLTDGMFRASKVDSVRLYPYINTPEGKHYISDGDWIITGIKNERYPCKDDIFRATYEPVEEDA